MWYSLAWEAQSNYNYNYGNKIINEQLTRWYGLEYIQLWCCSSTTSVFFNGMQYITFITRHTDGQSSLYQYNHHFMHPIFQQLLLPFLTVATPQSPFYDMHNTTIPKLLKGQSPHQDFLQVLPTSTHFPTPSKTMGGLLWDDEQRQSSCGLTRRRVQEERFGCTLKHKSCRIFF